MDAQLSKQQITKQNIATIAKNLLNSPINYTSIEEKMYCLQSEPGSEVNGEKFVGKMYGLYFYTDEYDFRAMIELRRNEPLPVYVIVPGSNRIYELKK